MISTAEPITVFSLDHIPILARYRELVDSMPQDHNDYTDRSGVAHSDVVIKRFHEDVVLSLIKQLTGREDIQPTYCFLSRYQKGAQLRAHTDRTPCHWTISQTVYVEPEWAAADWHIQIGGARIGLDVGQAVMFRGTVLSHSRPVMPSHISEYVNCYYHFVPTAYVGEML